MILLVINQPYTLTLIRVHKSELLLFDILFQRQLLLESHVAQSVNCVHLSQLSILHIDRWKHLLLAILVELYLLVKRLILLLLLLILQWSLFL